jgi:hypothetical protein
MNATKLILFVLAAGSAWGQQVVLGSMAQVACGGGQWTTTFTLINTGTTAANMTLNFFDDSGNALTLPFLFPQSATSATAASLTANMNPGSGLVIETNGLNGALVTGWAQLLSDGAVSGFAVFTDNVSSVQQQEAVVPLANRNDPAYMLWFDNTSGFSSGVALVNETATATTVNVVIRDDAGNQISTRPLSLPAGGHSSFDLASTFPETALIRGTLEFDTPASGQIAVLGLRFNPETAFTSIPALTKTVAAPAVVKR